MNDRDVEVLGRAPLFEALDEEGAKALRAIVSEVHLSRGQTLFSEDQEGDRLYVVLDGKIKLTRTAPDGRENLLSVLGPSEMFGELSLFDPRPRTASAIAVTESRLAGVGHNDLWPFLKVHPEISIHLLRALAQRLRRTNENMADLVFTDVPGRVAKALLDLAERFGQPSESGLHVHHDLTQEELAQLVGASRETVNKALADFAQRGWLRIEARAVQVLDIDRLRKRSR
ncbi:Crp/Fnr family transcriptional regulator [Actinoallomurus liliacearum]|uniref:Crp/Fnr family transcriptional regulator n=1 Tax=Actinoallomurus liliacearum TaxID=1080073 RepID=A0ABP8TZK1_9ACTN